MWILLIPAPISCVLGVVPRSQCAIVHMPMPSLILEAGSLTGESGRSLRILLFSFVDLMRDLQRMPHSRGPSKDSSHLSGTRDVQTGEISAPTMEISSR